MQNRFRWFIVLCALLMLASGRPSQAAPPAFDPNAVFGFLGDSITSNYGLPLDRQGNGIAVGSFVDSIQQIAPGATAINQGRSNYSANAWLPYYSPYHEAVAQFRAAGVTTVFIDLGVNEAKAGAQPPAYVYRDYMSTICTSLLADGFDRIILNAPTYVDPTRATDWNSDSNTYIRQYGDILAQVADGQNIFVGDTANRDFFGAHPELLVDGVHPTRAGAERIGQNWGAAYAALVVVPEPGTVILMLLPAALLITATKRLKHSRQAR